MSESAAMGDRALIDVVVLGWALYKGWRCVYAGCGCLEWRKGHASFKVVEDRYGRPDWLQWCWKESKAKIDGDVDRQAGED